MRPGGMLPDAVSPAISAAGTSGYTFRVLFAILVLGIEMLLIIRITEFSPSQFAVLHLLLATTAGFAAYYGASNKTPAILLALGVATMGPLGGLGAAVLILRASWSPARNADRSRWRRQLSGPVAIDDPQVLYEDIIEGRAYRPDRMPVRFGAIMAEGSVGDRQAVLGLIAKQRQPFPRVLVETALRSRDVAVRASAAAVVARLRERPRLTSVPSAHGDTQ